jgi:hypothetical protein
LKTLHSLFFHSIQDPGWHHVFTWPLSNHLCIAWLCNFDAILIASPGHDGFGGQWMLVGEATFLRADGLELS